MRKRNMFRDAEIVRLRRTGMQLEAIGQIYGLTKERVRQITEAEVDADEALKARGVERLTEEQVREAILTHRSQTLAAEALGVRQSTVWSAVKRYPELMKMWRRLSGKVNRGGGKPNPETPDLSRKAFELRQQGMSYAGIAAQVGKRFPAEARRLVLLVGPDPIGRTCARPRTKLTEQVVARAVEMRDQGMRKGQICAALGVGRNALAQVLP